MENAFYQLDECLGSACIINDKNAYSLFNADLKELVPLNGKITTDFTKALGASSLRVTKYEFETGEIKMVFYVGGLYKEDCYINTSNLIAECQNCIIKTDDDRFEYVAVLISYAVKETGIDYYNEVTLIFSAIKRLPIVTLSFIGSGTFRNVGSVASGMRIVVTPKSTLTELKVNDVTIKNAIANTPFVIDGLSGEVKSNGINRFLDTDLIDFPKVYPGNNTLNISNAECVIDVSYYPTFIV